LLAIAIAIGATAEACTAVRCAEGRVTAATGIVGWITGGADLVDALVAITIGIAAAANTAAAVGQTDRRSPATPGVIRRVAGLAAVGDALAAVAIAIGTTGDAVPGAVVLDTERR
jgi:hypothetical protein